MSLNYDIQGMNELLSTINQLEALPQKVVTKSARAGATIARNSARSNAPVRKGNLKKGIKLVGERSRTRGKKVYQVSFDAKMTDIFAKVSATGKRSYYPSSQEYGFKTRNGGHVEGKRFMRRAIDENVNLIQETMVEKMASEIDRLG